jgi:hypothetical protein
MGQFRPEDSSMPKKTTTNTDRGARIASIADAYRPISGDSPQDFATDLLTDLLHFSAAKGVRFGAALMHAQGHFAAEQIEGVCAAHQ